MSKYPIIRTIYLYLFSLVGLILIITGAIGFLNMGLKAWIFTEAEQQEMAWRMEPPTYYSDSYDDVVELKEREDLNEEQLASIDAWLSDYEQWQETQDAYDPVLAERHRIAALSLAQLLVGFPLFLFHWLTIKKESKKA